MSGPVSPPLTVKESDGSVSVRPTTVLSFNAADFTVAGTGSEATISIDSTGTGAALTASYIGFGAPTTNLLTGSANFTFVDESGGTGPTVLLTGDKPTINIQDDTGATDYFTTLQQSGASLFLFHKDSAGTNREMIRISNSYIRFNDDGEDVDVKMEGENVDHLFSLDAGQDNVGIGVTPDSDALFHVQDDGTKAATVRIESTDTDADVGPVLELRRDPAQTAVVNDDLGKLTYIGPGGDGSGTPKEYAQIETQVQGITSGQEHGRMMFRTSMSGTMTEFLRASASGVEINAFEQDIDTKISSDGVDGLFTVNAGQNNIGIGTNAPDSGVERLHVLGTGTGDLVKLESTDAGADFAPNLVLYRNSASPDVQDGIGSITFRGKDSGGNDENYVSIDGTIQDETVGSEDGDLRIKILKAGATKEYLRMNSFGVIFNELGADQDFKVETNNNANMLNINGGQDNIGIGGVPDAALGRLQVNVGNSTVTALTLISTDADAAVSPTLDLYRNSGTPADGDDIGKITFSGEDDGGAKQEWASISGELQDASAGSEDARLRFYATTVGATAQEYLRMGGQDIVFNEGSGDINFRVESNGNANMFKIDGGLNLASFGAAPVSGGATLQVPDNTISSYCNVNAVRSDGVATQTFLNEDCQGQTWVNDSSTAWTLDLPESTVKGMHFYFVSTNGDMTVDPNPSGGTSITLNGGTGALSRATNYEVYHVICYDTNKWLLTNPA